MKKLLIFGLILSVRLYSDVEQIQIENISNSIANNQFVMFEFSEAPTPVISKNGIRLFSVEF